MVLITSVILISGAEIIQMERNPVISISGTDWLSLKQWLTNFILY